VGASEPGGHHSRAGQSEAAPCADVALSESRPPPHPPVRQPEELREFLPGLEPERHVTDWGRSERVEGVVDGALYGFLYHYWFRVEVEGVENVPGDGPALLMANHAGVLPSDAGMIAKAIREEHRRPRPVHFLTTRPLSRFPGLDMLIVKLGGIADHPANVHRLLFDERQLVLHFPEGAAAASKPIKDRYRLAGFDRVGPIEVAVRARVPLVPVAVLGSEEAAPVLARLGVPAVRTPLPRLALRTAVPLPAKFKIRFLEPVQTEALAREAEVDRAIISALSGDIRALIQENLLEMVAQRRSVWLG
jgi:1-acyl-sn-glycerol-3-phosphate acyltransferase